MERVHLLYEVQPTRFHLSTTNDMHHFPTRKYLRCLIIFFVFFFFFMITFYVPAYSQTHTKDDQTHSAIIPGWSFNTSRDLHLYVLPDNSSAIIPQQALCSKPLFLLVIVCSAVSNFEARSAIRDTWGSVTSGINATYAVRVAFLLGIPDNSTLQDSVEEENSKYGDVIQEGFLDTYNNLTVKSVMLLKWATTYCNSVQYIMKTDDDMFVNIDSLVLLLQSKGSTNVLLGSLICGARPIMDPRSKWYAPRYMYSGKVYPNYLSGTGYIMSFDVAEKLYKAALSTPLFHLEDVYLTGICAKLAGIRPRDNPAFTYGKRPLDPCLLKDKSVVTSHRVDSAQLYKIWSLISDANLECSSFTSQKPSLKPSSKKVTISRRPGNRCV